MNKKNPPILLFSFLNELRRYDRPAYFFLLACIIIQFVFTIIKLKLTPFFLFGMFSEKLVIPDTVQSIAVYVNDKPIDTYDPSIRKLFLLQTNAANYADILRNNRVDPVQTRIESRYPFIYESAFYPYLRTRIYNDEKVQERFKIWFKHQALKVSNLDTGTVVIKRASYVLNRNTLSCSPVTYEVLDSF